MSETQAPVQVRATPATTPPEAPTAPAAPVAPAVPDALMFCEVTGLPLPPAPKAPRLSPPREPELLDSILLLFICLVLSLTSFIWLGIAGAFGVVLYWRVLKWRHLKRYYPEQFGEANRIGLAPLMIFLASVGLVVGGLIQLSIGFIFGGIVGMVFALSFDQFTKDQDRLARKSRQNKEHCNDQ